MSKVLVTGSKGFIGQNLVCALKERKDEVFEFDLGVPESSLREYLSKADIVYHLAGVNRPKDPKEFMTGNYGLTEKIVNLLGSRQVPIVITSSIQAELDNDYGKSKKAAEDYLRDNCKEARIYRLPNVFGKWSRPNYNSAIATFCHNIARDLPIQINDEKTEMTVAYIDDVVNTLIDDAELIIYKVTLGELVERIKNYKKDAITAPLQDGLGRKLHATYLSYLPEGGFSYPLKMNTDERGSFTEMLHTPERGQVSVNVISSKVTKGNHWHNTKNEKFLVVSGDGVIRFRRINDEKVIEYKVSGKKMEIVNIPPGYTHNIENIGTSELICVIWANEVFSPELPDTFYEEV